MDTLPQDLLTAEIQALGAEELRLESEVRRTEESFSGLRDIDLVLSLAAAKLSICVRLMRTAPPPAEQITEKSLSALRLVEGLLSENISEDQKGIVQANPQYAEVRARLEEFLLAGGGGFLEARQADARARRLLSRTIVAAIRKFTGVDDRARPLDLEDYPPFVRKALLFLFPVMVRENPEQPPYGIEEGQELTYSSRSMKLPLSQAIFYMENELLPELERKLAESPGSRTIQEEIRGLRERVEDYRKLRFFPRSTPVLLEKGYYTEGMTGYTADGEMLVPLPLSVTFRSGTNLDRIMEQVRMDVVRRIAGRGVSKELDREYRHLRSLESGIRGSSRTASMKLDTAWGYRVLRQEFPFLARLADKRRFEELVGEIQAGKGPAERRVEALMAQEPAQRDLLAPALDREESVHSDPDL
ncbi:MAG: hypothetical protein ABSG85_14210 [Spirochaetia bacterium]|jgi:hypothetical protein